jgi:uncharacterized ferredoxin-like protein
MSEQELVFNVRELHVLSLTCSECGHGTIFDFKSSDYLEKSVSPKCSVCKAELGGRCSGAIEGLPLFLRVRDDCSRDHARKAVRMVVATSIRM